MKEDEIQLIQSWENALKDFLDPLDFIGSLVQVFAIGSGEYNSVWSKRKEPHEAVAIAIGEVFKQHEKVTFVDIIASIKEASSPWLAQLVSGKIADDEVEDAIAQQENYTALRHFLTLISPHIKKTIQATDVADQLLDDRIIKREEYEEIECRVREDGNRSAVIQLLSILVRKPPGWWIKFTNILEDLNYDQSLVDSLQSLSSMQGPTQSASDVTEEQVHENGSEVEAKPALVANLTGNTQKYKAIPTSRKKTASTSGTTLRINQREMARDADGGENVPICDAAGGGKTTVVTHVSYTQFNQKFNEDDQKLPVKTFDIPPEFLRLNPDARNGVETKLPAPYGAVDVMTGDLANAQGSLQDFLEVVRRDHDSLYPPITGKFDQDVTHEMMRIEHINEKSCENPTRTAKIWKKSNSRAEIAVEKDTVFEDTEQHNGAVGMPAIERASKLIPTPCRSNNIIPKEAGYNTPLARSKRPVCGEASLSPQQKDIATKPINGENVIICAPDGSDRSRLIVHIIQSRFPHILDSTDRKIVLVGDKIVKQHNLFREWFQSRQWGVAHYDGSSERRLNDLHTSQQVVITTPKELNNWLSTESEVGRITELDILVMDECDKVLQNGPAKEIMKRYHETNMTRQARYLPQVIGLFSNVIVRTPKVNKALEQVKDLCAAMNAKGGIELQVGPVDNKSPLRRSKSGLKRDSSTKDQHCISDPFTLQLCKTMDDIITMLYTPGKLQQLKKINLPTQPNKLCKGSAEYSKWCDDLEISGDSNAGPQQKLIQKYANILRALSSALFIKGKCRAEDSFVILKEKHQEICGNGEPVVLERILCRMFTDAIEKLQPFVSDPRAVSSVLLAIEKELVASFKKKKSTVAILLVNDSQVIVTLQNWLNSAEALKGFKFSVERLGENTAISNSMSKTKKTTARILIGLYSNADLDGVTCDLIVCYDCENPILAKSQRKAKPPTIRTFTSTCLIADDNVKIERSLLTETAAKMVHDDQKSNREAFAKELGKRQIKIFPS